MNRPSPKDYPKPTVEVPLPEDVMQDEFDRGAIEATDGCLVEPDGVCPHGHVSWMLYWGII